MPTMRVDVNLVRPIANMAQRSGADLMKYAANILGGVAGGKYARGIASVAVDNTTTLGSAYNHNASAVVAFGIGGTSSGSVGATLGGTAVTVTYATSATASMTAWVAAVNANTTVNKYVCATNLLMKFAFDYDTMAAGHQCRLGNTVFTAVSGTAVNEGEFKYETDDATTAANFIAAVANCKGTAGKYVCGIGATAGDVYIGLVNCRTADNNDTIDSFASSITASTKIPTAGAYGIVMSLYPGLMSNFYSCVKSGTNVEDYFIGSADKLGGGKGGVAGSQSTSAASGVYLSTK